MKLKDTFISHMSDGEQVLVDISNSFSGVIRNNKTAAFIVEQLRSDAEAVIEKLRSVGAVEE